MASEILLIDDDSSLRRVTEYNLQRAGFTVRCGNGYVQGRQLFGEKIPDLVVTDVQLGDGSGLDLLSDFKEAAPDIPVIVITAFGSIEMAVDAMQRGAFTFITKPFDREALRLLCNKALELEQLRHQTRNLTNEVNRLTGTLGMETVNSAMAEVLERAVKVAGSDASIIIGGESGTGKEVLARLIHQHSARGTEPFVAVNCAAIPENLIESELFGHVRGAFTGAVKDRKGRFEMAQGGTLFLDEIAELRPELQVKFLRVLQERVVEPVGSNHAVTVDVRVIAASNKDIHTEIQELRFREDLYYRLSVISLLLPPLRERRDDIPALVHHFLKKHNSPTAVSFSPQAMELLVSYSWPGNIRELQNVVERCLILRTGNEISAGDVGLDAAPADVGIDIPPAGISLPDVEKQLILKAMGLSGGNRSQAARLLGIPRHVLIYRLDKFAGAAGD
ncbi:MAG: sigma-54 dependent transcriptional regulator [Desulfobulbaceae bacterium]|jgi:DNA-binding NtrC family response regulator|nr:sigma-54 dependent transcriptional regulator [Desulfobulbaceae bacterium]